MRVHLLQMDLVWEDKAANHAGARSMLNDASVSAGDLVVLPEMFDTGFSFKVERTADTGGETLGFLVDLAKAFGVWVHGGRTVVSADGEHGLNRCEVVGPSGEVACSYDKIHPFSYGRESERFVGGDKVVTYGWGEGDAALRVCPAICYDLRFPELFRRGLDLGAEAFAVGANWPAARAAHWRALSIARAIENQAFVFAVNRVGSDPSLSFRGGSVVVDPKGELLGELGDDAGVLSVEVDPRAVRDWRAEFPAWRDRSAALRDGGG